MDVQGKNLELKLRLCGTQYNSRIVILENPTGFFFKWLAKRIIYEANAPTGNIAKRRISGISACMPVNLLGELIICLPCRHYEQKSEGSSLQLIG
jgi:hypothetical protein